MYDKHLQVIYFEIAFVEQKNASHVTTHCGLHACTADALIKSAPESIKSSTICCWNMWGQCL